MKRLALAPILALIWVYQRCISPFTGGHCRFMPTCSYYAREAVEKHGACRGCLLALKRIARCHPWGGSGVDPVP